MGFFGPTKSDEEALRQAAPTRESVDGFSVTGSSAYDTADEYETELAHGQRTRNDPTDEVPEDSTAFGPEKLDQDNAETISIPDVDSPLGKSDEHPTDVEKLEPTEPTALLTMHQLDWDSFDDKGNPLNWPTWKKWYITFTTAILCLCVSLGSSLYVSGVFELMASTGASRELCVSGLTFYLVGLAFGPALAAPISEEFGRRIVYLVSFPVSMLFTMAIGLSDKIYQILILRFFCGLLASPALAVAGGSINDVWAPEERGFAMAMFCLAPFLGPVLGPIVGGFASEHKGWKWTMWVSLMFSGAILPFVLALPETYKPIILAKRMKKRGIAIYKPPVVQLLKVTMFVTMLRPMEMLVVEPIVLVWSFYIAFVFAVLFGFFEAFPIIFADEYGMDLGVSGLTFIGVGIGLILGVIFYVFIDRKAFPINPDGTKGRRDKNGDLIVSKPEVVLGIGKIGGLCLPISLFWLAWTGRKSIHWAVPTASGIPFGFGLILVFFTNMLYFSMAFPPSSVASALGANSFLRYLLASVFPLFVSQMYEKLHINWATSLFAFIAVAMLPIPWIFERIGPKLRQMSKFGYDAQAKK